LHIFLRYINVLNFRNLH